MWLAIYELMALFAVISTAGLFGWMFWEVVCRDAPKRHARYQPDPRALRRLQAKRRLALRQLGERWVLHSSQPPVKWGIQRE